MDVEDMDKNLGALWQDETVAQLSFPRSFPTHGGNRRKQAHGFLDKVFQILQFVQLPDVQDVKLIWKILYAYEIVSLLISAHFTIYVSLDLLVAFFLLLGI